MLSHLVRKPNKTEPVSILWLRRLIIFIFLLLLVGSFIVLFNRMLNEQPTISTTFTPISSLPAPVIYLGFGYEFTITCSIYYSYDGTKASNCDQYVMQPENVGNQDDYPFVGKFAPKDISLTRYNDTGPYFVFLHINIPNPTSIAYNDSTQQSSFRMVAYDSASEYNTVNTLDGDFNTSVSPFEESLFYINKHTLAGRLLYKFRYSRKIRNVLVKTLLAYVGFPSAYSTEPYIESDMEEFPMSASNTDYVTVRISPANFLVAEEREQRNNTILSILGTIAAFYSSIVFVYVFLFGVDSMRPWGIVHNGCYGFSGFRNKITTQVNPPDIEGNLTEGNLTGNNLDEMLLQRIIALETFKNILESNVVDMSLIKMKEQHIRRI